MKKRNLIIAVIGGMIILCFGCGLLSLILPGADEGEPTAVSIAGDRSIVVKEETAVAEPTATPKPIQTDTLEPAATDTAIPTPVATNTAVHRGADEPEPTASGSDTNAGDIAIVTEIIDGDTIDVTIDGVSYRVRYIGMDTPERGNYFFSESTEANRQLVDGQTVILVKDISETDQYGRLLRYVYLQDGTFVNAELVRQGYAQIATFPPDVRFQETFLTLQQEARESGRGLWGTAAEPTTAPQPTAPPPTPLPPPPAPTQPPPAPTQPPPGNCDPSYPTVCIPPPPPDLDCGEIPFKRFQVLPPDPHRFDGDNDGIGCES